MWRFRVCGRGWWWFGDLGGVKDVRVWTLSASFDESQLPNWSIICFNLPNFQFVIHITKNMLRGYSMDDLNISI